jgi:HK97 family phage portal protein
MALRQRFAALVGRMLRGINFPNWGIPQPGQPDLYQYARTNGADSNARKVAIGSAIRLITNIISTMPIAARRGAAAGTQPMDPQPLLLRDPDATGRGMRVWKAQMAWALAARGNCVGHITAQDPRYGTPATIVPIHPDKIRPEVDRKNGVITWRLDNGSTLTADEVWHVPLFPVPGQVWGLSPIEEHAATIGLALSAERFGHDYFDAGGHPTALLKSKDQLNDDQAKKVKQKFMNSTWSRQPVLLPDGIEYEAIQVTPEESQFLDTQKYTSAECARIFGPGMAEMLGYDTAGAMTYQNVTDRDLHLLKYTIDTYLVALEDALTACLPGGQYAKFNRNSMLRMNPLARAQVYQLMTTVGAYTPNTILALEDMPPVEWGDKPYPITKLTETEQIGAKPVPTGNPGGSGA